jgi:hypothetical protein
MRRQLVLAVALGWLAACNLFGATTEAPDGFGGWFHVDRPGLASSIAFAGDNLAEILVYGCSPGQNVNVQTPWTVDGDALVVTQWSTPAPRFTQSSAADGGLVAAPGMFGSSSEAWLPGASCLICPAGDAGVVVTCPAPGILDGGT